MTTATKWTHFWDMHSGGGQRLDWGHIFIEADEETARHEFEFRFGRDPDNVTCSCCGGDYSVSEDDTIEAITAYHRGDSQFHPGPIKTVEEYRADPNVLFITASEICVP